MVEASVSPVKTLLSGVSGDIPPNIAALFDNPQEIAAYESGDVKPGIKKMSKKEIEDYVVRLNGSVQTIENKIVGIQSNREMIIDFLGAAPGFVSSTILDVFEKIVSWFPQLGELLATIFGKKDFAEFMTSNREELTRSHSIRALRKYGVDNEKKITDSKVNGKIDMLKGTNLMHIDRVRLRPFFDTIQKE
jgi:hypothetical protein